MSKVLFSIVLQLIPFFFLKKATKQKLIFIKILNDHNIKLKNTFTLTSIRKKISSSCYLVYKKWNNNMVNIPLLM